MSDFKKTLGKKGVRHSDLHAGNIILQTKKIPHKRNREKIVNVVLIDFDMVTTKNMQNTAELRSSMKVLDKIQLSLRNHGILYQRPNLLWGFKWIGIAGTLKILSELLSSSRFPSTDEGNLYLICRVIADRWNTNEEKKFLC